MPHQNRWNWQQKDWPHFSYDSTQLAALELEFLMHASVFAASLRHITKDERDLLTVELLSEEALKTSEIEGVMLDRDCLQVSIRHKFGLTADCRKIPPAEAGIAEMMAFLYRQHDAPLNDVLLFNWQKWLMNGRRDLTAIGAYRTGEQPMQVVSGPIHSRKIHFEAPPASSVPEEMQRFLDWCAHTSPSSDSSLPILTRAGLAHLYFVSIHPFEDGNGRIGRAIVEKAIFEGFGYPVVLALSLTINQHRKDYYEWLERSNKDNEVTDWLLYFAKTILNAQAHAQGLVEFIIVKTKFYDRHRSQLNERQERVIADVLREGPEGFKGGLSAEKYMRITGTSRATATRDLQDLVEKKAFLRTGTLKSTRYQIHFAD